MDQPSLPTAADLGITDAEYEQILRDLRRSGRPVPAPLPAAVVKEVSYGPVLLVVLGLVAVVALVLAMRPPPEPTYAFLMETPEGDPVTYTSCKLIQVAVYPAGGPTDAEELVREAVDRVRAATGLDVRVVGAFGGHAPNWNFEAGPTHPEDPISVSWQDGDAIAQMTDHVAGLGGSRSVLGRNGTRRLVAGTIALSRDYYAELDDRGDRDRQLAVLLHEFGHVFGLDHVDSDAELMYGGGSEVDTFAAGDLQGLRRLGRGPCM
jgi:Matrixin